MTPPLPETRPLAGVTVLDFSTLLPGPLATLMLAEAGARVIKVERPGGEDMRFHGPIVGEGAQAMSAYYAMLNRGKEIFEVDLKSPDAVEVLRPLIESADVVMEQFRPGVMERLGLGYEALAAINPRIVYCAITGYGARGPRAAAPGHDLNYQATTGALAIGRLPKDDPPPPGTLTADIAGGTLPAVINILLALIGREKTGRGTKLDIAMTDGMLTFGFFSQAEGAATGRWPDPGAPIFVGSLPRYSLYRTKDERLLAVGALEDKFWLAFCDFVGLDAALRDDHATPAETRAAVAATVAERTHAEWSAVLAGTEFCVTPVATMAEAIADPHFLARGLFAHSVATPSGRVLPAAVVPVVPQFRGEPGVVPAPGA